MEVECFAFEHQRVTASRCSPGLRRVIPPLRAGGAQTPLASALPQAQVGAGKLETRKMLLEAADSQKPAAHFVSRRSG